MDSSNIDDLSLLGEINEDSLIRQLKIRYESNLLYTRISDNGLVVLNSNINRHENNNDFQVSLDYVTEYKNTSIKSKNSTHVYQMVNQIYLHMRRTGIDQSIVLRYHRRVVFVFFCNSHIVIY
jgi:chitin synthase